MEARPDEAMSDVDALVWAVEDDPRNRTTIAALARFAEPLDEAALRHRIERASRVVPRLRQRVTREPCGVGPPRWSIDPDFRLARHLRRIRMSDGSDRRLHSLARYLIVQPFDRDHPLWEFTYIDGLDDGGAALLMKAHHAVSDGVGSVELMFELFDLDADAPPERAELPPAPVAAASPTISAAGVVRDEARLALRRVARGLDALLAPRSAADVSATARRLGETVGATVAMLRPGEGEPVLPATRGAGLDLRSLAVDLGELRAAGRRAGGTINTAFVTAVVLGVHDHASLAGPRTVRVAVPVNVRPAAAAGGGNHWTPSLVDIPVPIDPEPDALATTVRGACAALRDDPTRPLLPLVAAGLRPLPDAAAAAVFGAVSSRIDVAASNVPGSPEPLWLCGRPVEALVPFGPLTGAAVNVTLLSHGTTAHIGISSDPAAIDDPDGLHRCLHHAFTAVVKGS